MSADCIHCGEPGIGTNIHYCVGDKVKMKPGPGVHDVEQLHYGLRPSKEFEVEQFILVLAKKDAEIRELKEIVENCCKPTMAKIVQLEKEKESIERLVRAVVVVLEQAIKILEER